jgi:4-oxalomesaconate tautomerase
MDQIAIPCTAMRGGTSKGLFFHAKDLPATPAVRDRVLLAAMGSPDPRQIDGLGGGHPLRSKVAIIAPPSRIDADVDYLFLQVAVDDADVRDTQNCGNMLAGVGPFAIEQGMVAALDGSTPVRIHMLNSGTMAVAHVMTPGGVVTYSGDTHIDGVPGTGAPVVLDFLDVAGSSCNSLLPTGNALDHEQGFAVTCIDNGMPVVLLRAADFKKTGRESPEALEADTALKQQLESIRLGLGPRMHLGDVAAATVPKMCLVAPATRGGTISTRTFIPHRVHQSIGVLGAASVAAACAVEGSIAQEVAGTVPMAGAHRYDIEHPTGFLTAEINIDIDEAGVHIQRSALIRTARKLMQGDVFVSASAWSDS